MRLPPLPSSAGGARPFESKAREHPAPRAAQPVPVVCGELNGLGAIGVERTRVVADPLSRLPGDLHDAVAALLPSADRARLSGVNRIIHESLAPRTKSDQLAAQAGTIFTRQGLQASLEAVQRDLAGHINLQATPLAALAGCISRLPEAERYGAFDMLLLALQTVPQAHRLEPFNSLALQVLYLPSQQRWPALDRMLQPSVGQSSEQRAGLLAMLAEKVPLLDDDAQTGFDTIHRASLALERDHRALPLAALGLVVAELPANEQDRSFRMLLRAAGELPVQHRAELLEALARRILRLSEPAIGPALDGVMKVLPQALPEHRAPVLVALTNVVNWLPDAAQGRAFHGLLEASTALPPEHHVEPLQALGRRLRFLAAAERQPAFEAMQEAVHALPPALRAEPLAALVGAVPSAVEVRPHDALRSLLLQTDDLSTAQRAVPMESLAWVLLAVQAELPDDEAQQVLDSLLQTAATLSAAHRAELLAAWISESAAAELE